MNDAGAELLRDVVCAARTSAPMWSWVDSADEALTRARAEAAPRIVHWRLAWARRIARLGCDLSREHAVDAWDGWEVSDIIESACRLVPAWRGCGPGHPGATLAILSHAPADPRPHLDALISVADRDVTLEPGFALLGRLIALGEPALALRAALASTWPATLNYACMHLEALLDPAEIGRLARHAWPALERWPEWVGHAGYGIEPRAWLAPHLEREERERTLRAIEDQLADPMVQDSQDFESPAISLIRALARVGEVERARGVLARSTFSDWEQGEAMHALEPADVERRREILRGRRAYASAEIDRVSTPETLVAHRARALDAMVERTARHLGSCLSRELRDELRPALERSGVPPDVVDRMNTGTRLELDEPIEGPLDEAWRAALDDADPAKWPTAIRWVALAEAEEGEVLVRAIVETVTSSR